MLGVGAGAPAPPLVPVACAVACLPPLLFLRRRPCAVAAAASSSKQREQGRRRRWWSDAEQEDEEEEEEEEGEEDFFTGSSSFGGELFDEPWFSKVFRTYGFLLPLMLASMLVATGPKAFLMAMAIPLAQSAVSFLLDAISRVGRRRTRRPFQEDDEYYEEEYEEFSDRSKSYHQSWVSEEEDDSSAKKSSSSFGGWDELLEKNKFASKGEEATGTRTAYDGPAAQGLSRRRFRRMSSATNKYKQAPLLMRLIVALFPFLGSWFRLL